MTQFHADPNKPGWGTYVNDNGQAAYDFFPNLAPPTQALNPSATGPAAPLSFTGGTPDSSTGGAPPLASMPPEPNQSVQPDANMSVAPTVVPDGVHPMAGQLLDALNAATSSPPVAPTPGGAAAPKFSPDPRNPGFGTHTNARGQAVYDRAPAASQPPVSSSSSTTVSGRPKAAIAADKTALTSNLGAAQTTNTDIGAARQARAETAAQGAQTREMSQALTSAGDLSKNLSEQATNNKLLSDSLAEKDPAVDPRRLIHNLSTGGTLLTTVLAAISGGFAAAAGQKTNPALDAINSAIDQDIDSQKTEIESGRIRRGNLIQAYRERGMRLDQAELAARATITESTRRYADAQAQELGAAANSEDATLLNQGLQTQYTQQVQALNQSGEAHSQTTVERKAPVGATLEKAMETDALLEKQGYSREQRASALRAMGLPPPQGPTAAEQANSGTGVAPHTPEERKDLATEAGKAILTTGAFKELDHAIGAHRDAEGNIVAHNGVISGTHRLRQLVESTGPKLGGALGGAVGAGVGAIVGAPALGVGALPAGALGGTLGAGAGVAGGTAAASLMSSTDSQERKAVDRAKTKIINALAHAKGEEGGSGAALSPEERAGYESMLNPNDAPSFYAGAGDLYRQKVIQPYKDLVARFGKDSVDKFYRGAGVQPPSLESLTPSERVLKKVGM